MAYMDIKPNEDDFAAIKGIRFFVDGLNVNWTSGQYRYDQNYFRSDGGVDSFVAAAGGKVRLDIIYVSNLADSDPAIETGSEVVSSPEYPATPADSTVIGYIGDVSTPIDENTDAVVLGSPTGTEVQLIDLVCNYRL